MMWCVTARHRFSVASTPVDHIKVNFDGATFCKGQELGIGVVARGVSGECLAWLLKRVKRMGDGELAEALAARETMFLALRKH
ncbi:UNVERIFIED_CONTAM: hypothetical protein Slati_1267500 [Sesamum latifolium]|uniref:RNase H type-1 domain-containing protein n=1 Tax=Sesamum latifolium TaxID=2727402 RepID=A0AAW2XIH1_9LAMI